MTLAQQAIDNYINGNLTEAKRMACRVGESTLFATLQDEYGKTWQQARTIAGYLKGKATFQAACDVEQSPSWIKPCPSDTLAAHERGLGGEPERR